MPQQKNEETLSSALAREKEGEKKGDERGGFILGGKGGEDSLSRVQAYRATVPAPRKTGGLRAPLVPRDIDT